MRKHFVGMLAVLFVGSTLLLSATAVRAQVPHAPVSGFADLHVHQFANLGFGGMLISGEPFTADGKIETALPHCDFIPADITQGFVQMPSRQSSLQRWTLSRPQRPPGLLLPRRKGK